MSRTGPRPRRRLSVIHSLLAAFAVSLLTWPTPLLAQEESLTGYESIDRELVAFLSRTAPPRYPGESEVRRFEAARELFQRARSESNPTLIQRAVRDTIAVQRNYVGGTVAGSVFACITYYSASVELSGWSYGQQALDMAEAAFRACRDTAALPLLRAAVAGQYGHTLYLQGRAREARVQLGRSFDQLRRRNFPDVDLAIRIGAQYAAALPAQEGARQLLVLRQAVAGRIEETEQRIRLLVALSKNALARGAYAEAESWASAGKDLLDHLSGISVASSGELYWQLAIATTARFGSGAAVEAYQLSRRAVERTSSNSGNIPLLLAREAIALHRAGQPAQAQQAVEDAVRRAAVNLPIGYRHAYYYDLTNYYGIARQCPAWVASARVLAEATSAPGISQVWANEGRYSLNSALLSCGLAQEAVGRLEAARPRRATAEWDWTEFLRRWQLAHGYFGSRRYAEATTLQTQLCTELIGATRSSFGRPNPQVSSTEGLTYSTALCYRALANFYRRPPNAGSDNAPAPSVPLASVEQAFLATQSALQGEPNDGISFSLGIEAARERGPEIAALVLDYENVRRQQRHAQRAFEDDVESADDPLGAQGDPSRPDLSRREAELRELITRRYPDYWRNRLPEPVGQDRLRTVLRSNEVLLMVSIDEYDYYPGLVFAVSPTGMAAAEIALPPARLRALVERLRDEIQPPARGRGTGEQSFDLAAAYELHQALLGDPAIRAVVDPADVILYVPSGHLRQLPLGVLVTSPPTGTPVARTSDELRAADWLIKRKAVAVFPTVASLVRLRTSPPRATAGDPSFIAFADPSFGPAGQPAVQPAPRDAEARIALMSERGYGDLEDLAPHGKNEMTGIADALAISGRQINIGGAASEASLYALQRSGTLGRARIIGFATHGLLPGSTGQLEEPALVLARSPAGGEDGLLTASEIVGLTLNAELVILSACDTGSLESGRSVAGLSRAFLQAGARSLLVTYWRVRNDIGPALLPRMFAWRTRNAGRSSAEALQAAMLEILNGNGPGWAHPAQWSAYVLVGDAR